MRISAISLILVAAVLVGSRPAFAADEKLSEKPKIEALIATIEKLTDATFIRNGKEYDCKAAAEHVRKKWKAAGDRIKTARDFIAGAASKSEFSGKPYRIRFKDGTEQTSAEFLTAELDKLEGKSQEQE